MAQASGALAAAGEAHFLDEPGAWDVLAAVAGDSGIASALSGEAVHIDSSTIAPRESRVGCSRWAFLSALLTSSLWAAW